MTEKIEYEQVTIQVPKKVMELLRFAEKNGSETPKDFIETAVLQEVRAALDADAILPNKHLAETFSLKPIYTEILGSY